jgi:hypothetical protein
MKDEEFEETKVQTLDKMGLDYKVISEDKDTITVFIKLKAEREKETQKNIAGVMVKVLGVFKCLAMHSYKMRGKEGRSHLWRKEIYSECK